MPEEDEVAAEGGDGDADQVAGVLYNAGDDTSDDAEDEEESGEEAVEGTGGAEEARGDVDGAEGVGRSPARKLAKATDAGDAQQGVGNAAAGAAARLTVADLFRKPRDSMGGAGGH